MALTERAVFSRQSMTGRCEERPRLTGCQEATKRSFRGPTAGAAREKGSLRNTSPTTKEGAWLPLPTFLLINTAE